MSANPGLKRRECRLTPKNPRSWPSTRRSHSFTKDDHLKNGQETATQSTPLLSTSFPSFPPHCQRSHPIREVSTFDYLGLRLDPRLSMSPAMFRTQEKVNKSQALVSVVYYTLKYDTHSTRNLPDPHSETYQVLQLWKSCVLPHFLQNGIGGPIPSGERSQNFVRSATSSS